MQEPTITPLRDLMNAGLCAADVMAMRRAEVADLKAHVVASLGIEVTSSEANVAFEVYQRAADPIYRRAHLSPMAYAHDAVVRVRAARAKYDARFPA